MKIIGGLNKGRNLKTAVGSDIRPTLARIRKSMFDVLQFSIEGSDVLDLYAGAGTLGIEALSRGAKRALFIDNSEMALKLIRENLESCGHETSFSVISGTLPKALDRVEGDFSIIFLDPPYETGMTESTLNALKNSNAIRSGSKIVVQVGRRENPDECYGDITLWKKKEFGDTKLYFYEVRK